MFTGKFRIVATLCATAVLTVAFNVQAEDPTTAPTSQPAIIHAGDQAAIDAAMEKDVIVEVLCTEAAWSNSGKVMNLTFDGTDETRLSAVVFRKNREKIDEAFAGDATKAWTGAKLRIHGKLKVYAGKSSAMKGKPEIAITDASQVTVVELPPTSQPAQ